MAAKPSQNGADEGEKEKTGVLVTPGILDEAAWEQATSQQPDPASPATATTGEKQQTTA